MQFDLEFAAGSSPLTRGKRHLRHGRDLRRGLIPAHAGKTREGVQVLGKAGAHPRSRGENAPPRYTARRSPGSSPLTPGKHTKRTRSASPPGLIPAHAGKTHHPGIRHADHPAHPRSRRENAGSGAMIWAFQGSSPLTRGKPDKPGKTIVIRRLIPAHAGKTGGDRSFRRRQRAHPRSRGENQMPSSQRR